DLALLPGLARVAARRRQLPPPPTRETFSFSSPPPSAGISPHYCVSLGSSTRERAFLSGAYCICIRAGAAMSRAAIVAREAVEFVYETAARGCGLAGAALTGVTAR